MFLSLVSRLAEPNRLFSRLGFWLVMAREEEVLTFLLGFKLVLTEDCEFFLLYMVRYVLKLK